MGRVRGVTRRMLATLACLLLVGCGAQTQPNPEPVPLPTMATPEVPDGAVALASYGFQYAPEGFMVPGTSIIEDKVDQTNTVVAVFTAPSGADLNAFLRQSLPAAGWKITADGKYSLLFERGELRGAFTVSGPLAALSIRSDPGS